MTTSTTTPAALETAIAVAPVLELASVYRENVAFVWRSLRRLGISESDLDDVCQEVFVVVHRKLASYDGSSSVRTWLFGFARRIAADHRKKAHVRHEAAALRGSVGDDAMNAASALPAASGATGTDALERQRARAVLDTILDELDEDKRAVFVLFELEEMSMAEVAQAVECPLQTAYSRLAAARKQVEGAVRRRQLTGGSR